MDTTRVFSAQEHERVRRAELASEGIKRLDRRAFRIAKAGTPPLINVYDLSTSRKGVPILRLDPRDAFDLGMALVNAAHRWEADA